MLSFGLEEKRLGERVGNQDEWERALSGQRSYQCLEPLPTEQLPVPLIDIHSHSSNGCGHKPYRPRSIELNSRPRSVIASSGAILVILSHVPEFSPK